MVNRAWKTGRDLSKRCVLKAETTATADELAFLQEVAQGRGQTLRQLLNGALSEGLRIACEQHKESLANEET